MSILFSHSFFSLADLGVATRAQFARISLRKSSLFSKIKYNDNNYFFDAALKGIFPISNKGFSVFGKAGMAEAHSVDTYKPVVYLDVGLGYDFTPKLEGTVQAFTTTESDIVPAMYAGTIGLTFLF